MTIRVPFSVLGPSERISAAARDLGEPTESQIDRFRWWQDTFFANTPLSIDDWFRVGGASSDRFAASIDLDGEVALDTSRFAWADTYDRLRGVSDHRDPAAAVDFSHAILPVLKDATATVGTSGILDGFPHRDALLKSFVEYLARRLQPAAFPAIGLALHFAKLTGRVSARSDKAAMEEFIAGLQSGPDRKALLQNFPLTDRMLAQISALSVDMLGELTGRLEHDAPQLRAVFGVETEALSGIDFGLGDPHAGGRCVCKLSFGDRQIMYKPKSLASDVQFAAVLDSLNPHLTKSLRHFRVLDRTAYGWAEVVHFEPCSKPQEIDDYYERLGAILAIHYALGATDVHFENLIACADTPIVVDTETIIQRPPPRPADDDWAYWNWHHIMSRHATVLGVGLLPDLAVTPEGEVYDLSGAGSVGSQATPFQQPQFDGFDDGSPGISYRPATLEAKENMPVLDGAQKAVVDHGPAFLRGFENGYRALLRGRSALMADDGPLARLARVGMRWVARPTVEYALTLRESFHPTCMRDGYERDVCFAKLLDSVRAAPGLRKLVPFEVRDLWQADIPYFKSDGNGRVLLDAFGKEVDAAYFDTDQPAFVRERMARLSPEDLSRQKAIIAGAIGARQTIGGPEQPSGTIEGERRDPQRSDIVDLLAAVERDLTESTLVMDGKPTWFAPVQRGMMNYSYDAIDRSLYSGLAGIGLFYAEYARHAGAESSCRDLATSIFDTLCDGLQTAPPYQNLSAFEGVAGAVYSVARMARCLDLRPRGLTAGLEAIRDGLDTVGQSDVISGTAGIILTMRCLLDTTHADPAYEIIRLCAEQLVRDANRNAGTASWPSGPDKLHLSGYAHGAGGIAAALKVAGDVLDDEGLHELAREAIAFENRTFDRARQNWQDQRPDVNISTAWCHGAIGIALSRLALRDVLSPDVFQADLERALAAIADNGAGGSHCLCHGSIGNAIVLDRCGERGQALAAALISQTIAQYRQDGRWRCGVGGHMQTPGLMLGKAGIGMGLIEHLRGGGGPSTLLLEA